MSAGYPEYPRRLCRPAALCSVLERRNSGGQRDAGWDGAGMARHRLAILPGVTHHEMSDARGLVNTALAFLDGADG